MGEAQRVEERVIGPEPDAGRVLAHPATATVGECCHGLIFGTPWPMPGDERQGWGREWRCERWANGNLVWRRVA